VNTPPTPDVKLLRGGRWTRPWLLTLTAACVGLLLVSLVGRGLHAPPAWFAMLTLVLPYLYGALGAALVTTWCLVPDRRTPPVLIGALLLAAGALWLVPHRALDVPSSGEEVRLMTWNVQRLWGEAPDPYGCVVSAVQSESPDVLTLLEVSANDVELLSAELGMVCDHATYHGTGEGAVGGVATCALGDRWTLRDSKPQRYVDHRDWFYLFSELASGDEVLNVLAVHLTPYALGSVDPSLWDLAPGSRLQGDVARTFRVQGDESAALLERVSKLKDPTVVMGDFNSTQDAALHVTLRGHMMDAFRDAGRGAAGTADLFGWLPLRVDYVYATPHGVEVVGARVLPTECSDHRPVSSSMFVSRPRSST